MFGMKTKTTHILWNNILLFTSSLQYLGDVSVFVWQADRPAFFLTHSRSGLNRTSLTIRLHLGSNINVYLKFSKFFVSIFLQLFEDLLFGTGLDKRWTYILFTWWICLHSGRHVWSILATSGKRSPLSCTFPFCPFLSLLSFTVPLS